VAHEFTRERDRPIARLRVRVAGKLAVVEDDHRERAGAVRLEYRGFERDVRFGNFDDGFVQPIRDGGQAGIERIGNAKKGLAECERLKTFGLTHAANRFGTHDRRDE